MPFHFALLRLFRVITPFKKALYRLLFFFTLRNYILKGFRNFAKLSSIGKEHIWSFIWTNWFESPLPKDVVCQVWLISQGLIPFWVRTELYHLYIWYHTVRTQNRLSPCGCIDIGPWSTWLWRRRWKCEKLQTDRQTTNVRQMSLKVIYLFWWEIYWSV